MGVMSTVSHWLPPGALIPWHFILVTKVCKMGFASQADPLAKTHRSWHLEVRLEFTEVESEGGGILMVRHTSATAGSATDTSAQIFTCSL